MHSFQWDELEDEAGYDFQPIRDAMNLLPLGEDLEFDLKKEPCYVANEAHDPPVREYEVWCDTDMGTQPTHCGDQLSLCTDGFRRAVPWDSYLWQTRDSFLDQLETYLNNTTDDHGITLIDRISIINPGLPGLEDGLRNAVVPFRDPDMPGYTRVNLLRAIGHELRSVQDHFPGKLLQIGFYTQLIDEVTDPPLWEWLYKDATNDPTAVDPDGVHLVALADEFNGVRRPRISFFEDNLAAARTPNPPAGILPSSNAPNHSTPPDITAYTISPTSSFLPTFESFPDPTDEELNIIYNSGYTFQANTIWSNPFTGSQGDKLTKTINGTPNDAMEGAFNAFLSQYLEIYPADIDEASPSSGDLATLNAELLEGELRSWHDYAAHLRTDVTPLEPPAGLTVERTASDDNLVKWHAVYGATSYSVQTITFGTSSPTWVDAVCEPGAAIECQDFAPKGAQYGYRVRASNGDGSITTDWAYVAVFLSEGVNDGYVRMNGTVVNDTTEPAIAAGRATGMNNFKGFLSFNTSALDGATVLAAKLRMYESVGSAFDPSHPCYIDVKKGSFNDNEMLEAADFAALETDTNVTQMQPLESPLSAPDWFEAEVLPTYLTDINTSNDDTNHTGRTQFRLYFTTLDTNKQATWYSGDSTDAGELDRPPQLVVQYQP